VRVFGFQIVDFNPVNILRTSMIVMDNRESGGIPYIKGEMSSLPRKEKRGSPAKQSSSQKRSPNQHSPKPLESNHNGHPPKEPIKNAYIPPHLKGRDGVDSSKPSKLPANALPRRNNVHLSHNNRREAFNGNMSRGNGSESSGYPWWKHVEAAQVRRFETFHSSSFDDDNRKEYLNSRVSSFATGLNRRNDRIRQGRMFYQKHKGNHEMPSFSQKHKEELQLDSLCKSLQEFSIPDKSRLIDNLYANGSSLPDSQPDKLMEEEGCRDHNQVRIPKTIYSSQKKKVDTSDNKTTTKNNFHNPRLPEDKGDFVAYWDLLKKCYEEKRMLKAI